jgi:hypothetical protein
MASHTQEHEHEHQNENDGNASTTPADAEQLYQAPAGWGVENEVTAAAFGGSTADLKKDDMEDESMDEDMNELPSAASGHVAISASSGDNANIQGPEAEDEDTERRNDDELRDYEDGDADDEMVSAANSGDSLLDELMADSKDEEPGDIDVDGIFLQAANSGFGSPLLRTPAHTNFATATRTQDWLDTQPDIRSSPPPLGPTYRRPYVEPEALPANSHTSHSSPSIQVIVGPDPPSPLFNYSQRTFFLPSTLLTTTSLFFRSEIAAGNTTMHLPSTNPTTFQNYIDFTHSNIFSPNKTAANFALLPAHIDAWLLGSAIDSPALMDAVMKALHTLFCRTQRTQVQAPITAADIVYVVAQTAPGSPLRALFFDAVAAHWTRFEAFSIGNDLVVDDSGVSWGTVYNRCADFRTTLAMGLAVVDDKRGQLFGAVGDYVSGRLTPGVRVREVLDAMEGQ